MLIANRLLTPTTPLSQQKGWELFDLIYTATPLIIFTASLFLPFKGWWNTKHDEYEWSCSMNKIMEKLIIIIVMLSQASCDHIKTIKHCFSLFNGFINIFFSLSIWTVLSHDSFYWMIPFSIFHMYVDCHHLSTLSHRNSE
jgi:hypothetical protein